MKEKHAVQNSIPKSIVWTIAGSDSGGGAGIQADLHAFQAMNAYGCSVIVALTAQNSVGVNKIEIPSCEMIEAQIKALEEDLPANAIKIGMLGNEDVMREIKKFLTRFNGKVVVDPVIVATSGAELLQPQAKHFLINEIFPHADLITPNLNEVRSLLNCEIKTFADIEAAAKQLKQFGCKQVLIKGGHGEGDFCHDYIWNGNQGFWLSNIRHQHNNNHGSGCTLSSAIAALLAQNYSLENALVIAKAYVSQGIRLATQYGCGPGPVTQANWPNHFQDFPWVTNSPYSQFPNYSFKKLEQAIGFYPIVDSADLVKQLAEVGVRTIQLRVKHLSGEKLEQEISAAIEFAKQHHTKLFINDYWQLAIKFDAYGVHLGQEDIETADLKKIADANLALGISTHDDWEIARAHALSPSYIAFGSIYPTTTKQLKTAPQGLEKLSYYCNFLPYPVVAIGGINLERLPAVLQTGANGVAVVSAITKAIDPIKESKIWLENCDVTYNN